MAERKTRPTAVMTNTRGDGFADIISSCRVRAGMTQSGLAKALGVTVSAVGNWEAGLRRPDISIVPELCRVLGIQVSALFGVASRMDEIGEEGRSVLSRYKALTADNRLVVSRMLDNLLDAQTEALRARVRDMRRILRSELKACAGWGNALDEARGEDVYVHADWAGQRADEIIAIAGDSMEPTFHDGDQVFVSHCETLRRGEIGIFVADGAGYIKEFGGDALVSHNPAYAPLPLAEFDDVRCVGRVTGLVRPEDYATQDEIDMFLEMRDAQ